ncbi:unnamed protein product [Adineta ricciae]|uniref:Right handed beta helix domain-containing protein n=1 Tax=Adineta ricciae TaxID=249248 RepID=A0A815MT59_ADIRI|nr:unnamed protein product [Adineta ricciae]
MWSKSIFVFVACLYQSIIAHCKIITPDDANALQSLILSAYNTDKLDSITLTPGIYRIPFNDQPNSNIILSYLRNYVINAQDVTLLMLDNRKRGITFYNCYNVTVRGSLIIRNDVIPFTQGTIESIHANSFILNIHDGYPTTLDDSTYFSIETPYYIFDRHTHRLKDKTFDYYNRNVTRIDSHRFQVTFYITLGAEIAVGDLVSMRGKGNMGILTEVSEKMHYVDVIVEYAGSIAWFEMEGMGNNRYERISVRPGPKPLGATEEPLMSANADGFHSSNVFHGPTVINSFFTQMPDDGIAIHGEYQIIRQVNENIIIIMRKYSWLYYRINDRVVIMGEDGVPKGETRVLRIRTLPMDYLPLITPTWPHFQNHHYYYELELETNLNGTIVSNDFISDIDRTGSGYVLQGNTILNHRARGILVKARDGLIESNLINGSSMAAIVMQPELWWAEGNYAEHVIIRNNTLMKCGYATSDLSTEQAGVLTIFGTGKSQVAYGHDTITIENNLFVENDGVHMILDGLQNSVVKGNRFYNGQHNVNDRGSNYGWDGGVLVYVNRAKAITLQGNRAWCLGSAHKRRLQMTYLATHITGSLDGVIVESHC